MKVILAVGGSVIKTAEPELREVVRRKLIDVLVHNGASVFHDFQLATERFSNGATSHPLEALLKHPELNKKCSEKVWNWINDNEAPKNSITKLAMKLKVRVLIFTALGADFWHLSGDRFDWSSLAARSFNDFGQLCAEMQGGEFHYISMGSAVIHPEVFIKALAVTKPKKFRADVVDFLEMYRPRTRVSKYGSYFKTTHKEFLAEWLKLRRVPEEVDIFSGPTEFQDFTNH